MCFVVDLRTAFEAIIREDREEQVGSRSHMFKVVVIAVPNILPGRFRLDNLWAVKRHNAPVP